MNRYISLSNNRAQDVLKIRGVDFDLSKNRFSWTPMPSWWVYPENSFNTNTWIWYFPSLIEEILNDISDIHAGDINSFLFRHWLLTDKYIDNSLFHTLHNSFDALKDNYLTNPDFIWKITINIIINTKRKVITIIVKDNWAGKQASDTKDKRYNKQYLWWVWEWENFTKSECDNYYVESDFNWHMTLLQFRCY